MSNIISDKVDENQNNIEIPFHSTQNAYHQGNKQILVMMQKKRDPYTLLHWKL
jgi:hypothetical protein